MALHVIFSIFFAIFARSPNPVEPYWMEGAGHYTIPDFILYCNRINHFISNELTKTGDKEYKDSSDENPDEENGIESEVKD